MAWGGVAGGAEGHYAMTIGTRTVCRACGLLSEVGHVRTDVGHHTSCPVLHL